MARVKSFLRLQGSMGETTFVKQGAKIGGYRSQDKKVTSPDKFKNDPKMARVRENAGDFKTAARGAKLIRNSISSLVKDAKDSNLTSRMLKTLMAIVKSDAISPAGQGNLVDGNLSLLNGFHFNEATKLSVVMSALITHNINRVTGLLTINIPVFTPSEDMKTPRGAARYQFVSAGIEMDFANGTSKADIQKSAQFLNNTLPTTALTLTHTVTANSTLPLFLVFGIRFLKQVNNSIVPLLSSDSSLLVILDVSKV